MRDRVCTAIQLGEKFFVMIATVSDDNKDDLLNKLKAPCTLCINIKKIV